MDESGSGESGYLGLGTDLKYAVSGTRIHADVAEIADRAVYDALINDHPDINIHVQEPCRLLIAVIVTTGFESETTFYATLFVK